MIVVPEYLKGMKVATSPPPFRRTNIKKDQQGIFLLDDCNQKELKYLYELGIDLLEMPEEKKKKSK